jgi:Flp pilus assembly protein TadG
MHIKSAISVSSYLKRQKGTAAMITILMMTVILSFCALVVDIGRVSVEKNKLQNAIDAAALAAAQDLPDTAAATHTAYEYMGKNGYSSIDILVSFARSDRRISVTGTENVDYTFARVLGLNNTDVKCAATAEKGAKYLGGAFDYSVFSGSPLDELAISGNPAEVQNAVIEGSVHSNNDFRYNGNGSSLDITGTLDTVGQITINGSGVTIGNQSPNSSFIDLPDFSEIVKQLAQSSGNYYSTSQNFNSDINLTDAIYVDGRINFNCNQFSGVGTIMATGNIVFNNSIVYGTPESSVCIYSKNGNITINNTSAIVNGTFYAPNGTVTFNNGAHTVYGKIIAKKLTFNGGVVVHDTSTHNMDFMDTIDEGIRLVK